MSSSALNGGAFTMKHFNITEDTLTKLQTFDTVEEMNESIKLHKANNELSQRDKDILDAISRYSCKYVGVSYLSKQKIAEDAGFKSRRTAIRACKRLEALEVIKQYETRRIKGDKRRSTNVIVINPIVLKDNDQKGENTRHKQQSPRAVTSDSHGKQAPNKSFIKHNTSNTYKDTEKKNNAPADFIKKALKHAIPTPIYDALSPFFDGQGLYDTYGILLRAKASIDRNIRLEEHAERYINAFYNVVRLYKSGKVRKSLKGLLYVSWERITSEISRLAGGNKLLAYDPY